MQDNFSTNSLDNLKLNGFYRGIVLDNNDPLKSGRIKVKVYPVFKDLVVDDLPWAIMADPMFGGYADVGSIFVPVVDAHVFVFFENGDHRFPVYFAGAPAIQTGTPDSPSESRTNGTYPNNRVYKSKSGIVVEIDDTNGSERYKITHPTGSIIEIDGSGNLKLTATGNTTVTTSGNTNLNTTGNTVMSSGGDVTISGGGTVSITGSTITLN